MRSSISCLTGEIEKIMQTKNVHKHGLQIRLFFMSVVLTLAGYLYGKTMAKNQVSDRRSLLICTVSGMKL